jgi:hypothetical protein
MGTGTPRRRPLHPAVQVAIRARSSRTGGGRPWPTAPPCWTRARCYSTTTPTSSRIAATRRARQMSAAWRRGRARRRRACGHSCAAERRPRSSGWRREAVGRRSGAAGGTSRPRSSHRISPGRGAERSAIVIAVLTVVKGEGREASAQGQIPPIAADLGPRTSSFGYTTSVITAHAGVAHRGPGRRRPAVAAISVAVTAGQEERP